jgi:hypothetical protein
MYMTKTGNGHDVDERAGERAHPAHKSLGALAGDLAKDTRHLIELEFEAAKLDIQQEIDKAKQAAASASIGGAVAGTGALMLVLAVAFLLFTYTALALWAAFAIVGGALLIIGGVALMFGVSRAKQMNVPGKRAALEAKEDATWIKEHASVTR